MFCLSINNAVMKMNDSGDMSSQASCTKNEATRFRIKRAKVLKEGGVGVDPSMT